jgi:hypothetical protein
MSSRIHNHIRSNVVGYVAVFIALSGTAYAVDGPLAGQDTVGSADIINGEVRNKDLGADAVASGKIADRQVKNADLSIGASSSNTIADGGVRSIDVKDDDLTGADIAPDSLTGAEIDEDTLVGGPTNPTGPAGGDLTGTYPNPAIAAGAVNSAKVANNSLTGEDIDESMLGIVPNADFAFEANQASDSDRLDGLDSEELMAPSRYAQETAPVGLTSTGQEVLTTAIPMTGFRRLMATATVRADSGGGNDDVISCIVVIDGSASPSYPEAIPDMTPQFADVQTLSLSFARDVGAGTKDVALRCHAAHGSVVVQERSLLVWAVDRF